MVDAVEDDLGKPFVIDPGISGGSIRIEIGEGNTASFKDLFGKKKMAPEVRVDLGVGKKIEDRGGDNS